jgi:hypothetical protein
VLQVADAERKTAAGEGRLQERVPRRRLGEQLLFEPIHQAFGLAGNERMQRRNLLSLHFPDGRLA